MAKKKVTYTVFATVTVDEDTDTNEVSNVLQRAANGQGWHFSASVSEEDEFSSMAVDELYPELDDY